MKRAGAGAVAAGLAATLAACGGSLSLKDLRAEAGARCERAGRQAARISPPATPAGTRSFLAAGLAVLRPELADLRGLDPPAAQSAQYREAIGALAEEVQLVHRTQLAIGGGADSATAVEGLQRALTPVRARGDEAWRAVGIAACVSR